MVLKQAWSKILKTDRRGGSMALRWAVTGLMEAEKRFRRVKGHREMPQLLAALSSKLGEEKAA